MAKKPARKTMNKKSMKKAKGGVLIGMLLPAVQKVCPSDPSITGNTISGNTINGGTLTNKNFNGGV